MSLAITVQGFRNKEIHKFRRSIVWDIFESKSTVSWLGWDLWYDGRNGGFLYLDEDELIDGFGIQSASDPAIRDLYAAARQVSCAIHLDDRFFVTDSSLLKDLPDWTSTLPRPVRVVHNADELLEFLAEW